MKERWLLYREELAEIPWVSTTIRPLAAYPEKKTTSALMGLQSNGMRVFLELPANWTDSLQQHFLLSISAFSWGF